MAAKEAIVKYQEIINQNEKLFSEYGINKDEGFWLFGYGSLLWKVNFEYEDVRWGTIKGYKRRFWQGSKDHRGTPEFPGRVVTLVPDDQNSDLLGKAYYIPPKLVKSTLDILNFREKGGYSLCKVPCKLVQQHGESLLRKNKAETESNSNENNNNNSNNNKLTIDVLLYIAIEGNHDFLGFDSLDNLATQISQAWTEWTE